MVEGKRRLSLVGGAMVFLLVATSCGDNGATSDGSASVEQGLTGSIAVSGSSTVEPISNLVAELFNEPNPDVKITVDGPGTGDGFALLCTGEIDIADASRPIADDEIAACDDGGIEYQELEVALDGITVMVNSASAIECLTTADLYAIFGPGSEGINSTADANVLSKKVGGTGNIPEQDLEITAPGEESGTYDAFITLAGIEDTAIAQGVAEDKAAALRADYQSSANDNVIIQAVEGSPNAIGFVGFAFAEKAGDQVKEVAIDAGNGCVAPAPDTIADASYPLSRSLFIYPNVATAGEDNAVKAFVDYYLTEDGLVTAVEEAGYIALPADRQDASRSAWTSAVS
jgi:phosphate transport system substrate-binding protein